MSPAMRDMCHYPRYLLRHVEPVLGKRVLEIGVGHGQYTRELRRQGRTVLATDVDAACVAQIAEHFAHDTQVLAASIDLREQASIASHRSFLADSVLCLNVLEHIEDDMSALGWLRETVAASASLALIVPAHQRLYGRMDREAGHYRRYTRGSLGNLMENAGWHVERMRYVNLAGAAGWWYHNRVRTDAGLTDTAVNSQMRAADRWLPKFAVITDPLFGGLLGLSVVAWGRKRGSA